MKLHIPTLPQTHTHTHTHHFPSYTFQFLSVQTSTIVESLLTGQQLPVPAWIIALAILAGLLALALLIFIMYKVGLNSKVIKQSKRTGIVSYWKIAVHKRFGRRGWTSF